MEVLVDIRGVSQPHAFAYGLRFQTVIIVRDIIDYTSGSHT